MSDQVKPVETMIEPRKINKINVIGLQTLIGREVGRFMNIYTQTIIAPMITTLLFYAVFALAFGGIGRTVGDIPYLVFLAPGLMMMTMVQNAFANTSSSLVVAKVQGNIVDVLMPPLSAFELYLGFVVGGIARGLAVGTALLVVIYLVVGIEFYSVLIILAFAVLGNMMLATIGLAAGIWSEKFDHISAVSNFVVTPLTFLSGTFYSITQLPPFWQSLAHYNPFFYMIDGFRYGFIGYSDGNVMVGLTVMIAMNVAISMLAYGMLKTGYKIKT